MIYVVLLGKPEACLILSEHRYPYHQDIDFEPFRYICDPLVLGQKTLDELAVTWYRRSTFVLSSYSKVANFWGPMFSIWKGANIDRARNVIRVHFPLSPRTYTDPDDDKTTVPENVRLPSDFEQLADLHELATLTIHTYSSDWYYHGDTKEGDKISVETLSRRVFPLLNQLKANGVEIVVKVDGSKLVEIGTEHLNSEGWSSLVRETRKSLG
jgi:hypothetical protein